MVSYGEEGGIMIKFDYDYFKKISKEIFLCDSPTGYTFNVINLVKNM